MRLSPRARAFADHALPPLLFIALVLALVPFAGVFAFDPDEGNNLMKTRLVADGHRLYSEIWSDQPPLFTHMLRAWLPLTGWTVTSGRLLVLLCSGVLIWAFYQSVRLTAGRIGAIAATALLVTSFGYTRLSVSVMLAVPSLMFAMLGVYGLVRYHRDGRNGWLVMSGVCMGLSVLVKMWTLLPAAVVVTALVAWGRRRALPWWIGPFVVTSLLLLALSVPPGEAGQLVSPHLDVRGAADFTPHLRGFERHFVEDLLVVVPALLGVVVIVRRRLKTGLLPAGWAALALVVLLGHEPLWYHHYLLVSIPLCWCAGFAAVEIASRRDRPALAAAVVAVAWFAAHLPAVYARDVADWKNRDDTADRQVLAAMADYADRTRYVMTDQQIHAFRAGLRVPPPLAVTSLKRRWSGQLDDDVLIGVLDAYRPEQVYLTGRRLPVTPALMAYLRQHYRVSFVDPRGGAVLVSNTL